MKLRYRKRTSSKVWRYSARNISVKPGDLMVTGYGEGKLYRLEDRRIGPAASRGKLYPREIKPPANGLKAIIENDEVYWVDA